MKILSMLLPVFFMGVANAQLQAKTLGPEVLNNNKVIIVENQKKNSDRVKLKVRAIYRGEPAMLPVYLYSYIKCGDSAYKPMDLAREVLKSHSAGYARYVGAPTSEFKSGVFHVCALENVNFDDSRIFISVFTSGSEGCNRREIRDFIFPITAFCK